MVVGVIIVLCFLIISVAVLLGIYMYFCSENGTKMFADPRYDERINKLEKQIEELKKE